MLRFTFLFLLLVLAAAVPAKAQKTLRVWFLKGATKATAYGQLNGYPDSAQFIIRVRPGQSLDVKQLKPERSTHYASLSITDPTGAPVSDHDASCNSEQRVSQTVAGDYVVRAVECQKADPWNGNFRLRFTVK